MYKISVIVPVYKAEKHLSDCLESIKKQTIFDYLQLILVDDGSPDISGKICDSFAEKHKNVVVIHKENGGVSSARNAGLDVATGEFIGFVDADDTISNNYFELSLDAIAKANADMAFGGFYLVLQNNQKRQFYTKYKQATFFDREAILNDYAVHMLTNGQQNSVWTKLFRRSIIEENSLVFPVDIRIGEDKIFILRYLKHCQRMVCTGNYGYFYRDNNQSAMHTNKKMQELLLVYEKEEEEFINLGIDPKTVCERKACYLFLEFADFISRSLNVSISESIKTVKNHFSDNELMKRIDSGYDYINATQGRIYRWLNKAVKRRSVVLALAVLIMQKIINLRGRKK